MKPSKVSPSVHYAAGTKAHNVVLPDFGTLVPLNFYNLAISLNSYLTDFSAFAAFAP